MGNIHHAVYIINQDSFEFSLRIGNIFFAKYNHFEMITDL